MAGIKGTKQKKSLTEDQVALIFEKLLRISCGKKIKLCLLKKDLDEILSVLNMTKEALQRRWSVSQSSFGQINFCYDWEERLDNSLSTKCYLFYTCEFCKEECILMRRKFLARKVKSFKSCGSCHARNVSGLPEQKLINSEAQKIAQNRPETIKKMSDSIIKAWQRDYTERCDSIRKSYNNNPAHRENIRIASLRMWSNEEYRKKVEKSQAYCWGYHKDIFYQSLCELAFVLWCEDRNIEVRRYDGEPIRYVDAAGINRHYIPDFIMRSNTIVEVKSSLDREKSLGRLESVLRKSAATSELCKSNGWCYRIVEIRDLPSFYYRKAGKIHHGKT